ncbi:MAG: SUMF1/EgtB/PvdO family nonheme iron enzyme [Sphingobacteriales bacterium]|nr:MAG: SUMF1/EgtB/PvdO family nonheme iron enzyme [Sphingobacteriales bacterium]
MLLNDRYEYNPDTDLIGKGGLAEVFKAYDKQRGIFVALKKFLTADSLKYGIREEFQKSIQFAHGNIVRAYDFFTVVRKFDDGETHETQYGVMELIEGGDLTGYLNKKPDNGELLEVVKGILRGLDYLHKPDSTTDKGSIIHRDIKPGNILIFYNNEGKPIPKIADFNVAKEMSGNLESSVSMVGTYEYMAPEQLNVTKYGMGNHVHANADLWALGVILCDYFMGKSLFGRRSEGNTQGQIIGNILDKPIPSEVIKSFPAPFNGIIARCLVRNAKDRVQSAGELLEFISKNLVLDTTFIDEKSAKGRNTEVTTENKNKPKPKYTIVFATAALLFAILLGLIIFLPNDTDEPIVIQKDTTTDSIPIASVQTNNDTVEQVERLLNEANALFVENRYNEAKEKAQSILKIEPNNLQANNLVKKCEAQLNPPKNNETITEKKTPLNDNINGNSINNPKPADNKTSPSNKPSSSSSTKVNDPFAADMVYVEGGTFMMGSPDFEAGRRNDEYQHQVTVSSFKMGKYEVTQAQWQSVMGNNPSYHESCNQCPVKQISWNDIQEFLFKLNNKTGRKYRLPTEAEWEFAARGGNRSRSYLYSGSNALSEVGWYYENSSGTTHPVGEKTPNELGLYDMSGNVWEWCSDWFDSEYYKNSPSNNPKGPSTGALRVLRGGGWDGGWRFCRLAYRHLFLPGNRYGSGGFRLVVVP